MPQFGTLQYHGKIPSKKRDGIIDQFKEDPNQHVLLMSYGAGSVGLNLQFCEYVFLFDRWWNPAIEDQAINRAHRIGAKGAVTVSRMISMGTIEERIHQILEDKRELFATVFSETERPQSKQGFTQEFFIEGGRSRTGKTLPPKMGFLSMLVEAFVEGRQRDAIFVPTHISFEKIIESGAYMRELGGGEKEKETAVALLKSTGGILRSRYGRVFVTFDEPAEVVVRYHGIASGVTHEDTIAVPAVPAVDPACRGAP